LAVESSTANVVRNDGFPIEGLFAAGEMVGGLVYANYPEGKGAKMTRSGMIKLTWKAGSGWTAGAVFGRRASVAGAKRAQQQLKRNGVKL